jgi:hypothetical protein
MDDNYFYMQESNKHIIILCPNCGQKIRLPIVRSTLEVFCKICRNSFPYEYGEGFGRGRAFQFIVPHELIVFYISSAWLVMGGIASLFHAYLSSGTREREFIVLFLMTLCVALVLCISSGIRIFLDVKGIPRILRLGKVICSRYGMGFYNKNGDPELLICWKQIINVKILVRRHAVFGMEVGKTPSTLILKMKDGNTIKFPMGLFLAYDDNLSLLGYFQKYLGISFIL